MNGRDHRHGVRCHVDQPCPAFGDRHRLEDRKVSRQIRLGFRQDRLDRLGIENPNRLKRRGTIKGPGSRNIPFLDETATDPQAKLAPLLRERGKEIEEEPKAVRYDRGDVRAALGHRIAAVKTLAKSKIRRADRVVRCPASSGVVRMTEPRILSCGKSSLSVSAEPIYPLGQTPNTSLLGYAWRRPTRSREAKCFRR